MKKLIGIFDIKTNTPEEIYQKVKETLENRSKQKKLNNQRRSSRKGNS